MKKVISIVLVFVLSVSFLCFPCLAKTPTIAMPCYENVSLANASLSIGNSGIATINIRCVGVAGTTSIRAVTYGDL